jgi:hypothetical protein
MMEAESTREDAAPLEGQAVAVVMPTRLVLITDGTAGAVDGARKLLDVPHAMLASVVEEPPHMLVLTYFAPVAARYGPLLLGARPVDDLLLARPGEGMIGHASKRTHSEGGHVSGRYSSAVSEMKSPTAGEAKSQDVPEEARLSGERRGCEGRGLVEALQVVRLTFNSSERMQEFAQVLRARQTLEGVIRRCRGCAAVLWSSRDSR